jgi:hypothetical protein
MREIKFRAKVEGKIVYSDGFMKHPNGTIIVIIDIMDEGFKTCPIDKGTLEQFTGLKDNKRTIEFPNGQDIYEGDIINCFDAYGKNCKTEVRFSEGAFLVDCENSDYNITAIGFLDEETEIEVIGNIHENKL